MAAGVRIRMGHLLRERRRAVNQHLIAYAVYAGLAGLVLALLGVQTYRNLRRTLGKPEVKSENPGGPGERGSTSRSTSL